MITIKFVTLSIIAISMYLIQPWIQLIIRIGQKFPRFSRQDCKIELHLKFSANFSIEFSLAFTFIIALALSYIELKLYSIKA